MDIVPCALHVTSPRISATTFTNILLLGCANSIFSKYQDMQCVENCSSADPSKRVVFEQPVWQTLQMFVGEVCVLAFGISSITNANRHRHLTQLLCMYSSPFLKIGHSVLSRRTPHPLCVFERKVPDIATTPYYYR